MILKCSLEYSVIFLYGFRHSSFDCSRFYHGNRAWGDSASSVTFSLSDCVLGGGRVARFVMYSVLTIHVLHDSLEWTYLCFFLKIVGSCFCCGCCSIPTFQWQFVFFRSNDSVSSMTFFLPDSILGSGCVTDLPRLWSSRFDWWFFFFSSIFFIVR